MSILVPVDIVMDPKIISGVGSTFWEIIKKRNFHALTTCQFRDDLVTNNSPPPHHPTDRN